MGNKTVLIADQSILKKKVSNGTKEDTALWSVTGGFKISIS
jgi:hypothetical protein